ncbi:hypothetical protein IQ231_10300 [Cuspidothrix issatschenkoi LEGE 03284]|uniref:hypothetical protein n=1 Tax=Cuspidothrix issatschenkoi TaxID=230752 RepID=UPI00188202C0|nr:hypothetical protein [Cuspidothrix issatschenkoi]MBE9232069.1 hypothetical protein [Cuspidothrix issatschenkoi LEGE 03284]
MSVNIPALIKYLDLLCELEDGDEICVGGYTIKREGNKIWQHIFDHHKVFILASNLSNVDSCIITPG